jgi:ankyrin repeat protein
MASLYEWGADVNCTTSSKITPLHLAAENGYSELCHIFMDKGAKPEMMTRQGEFPLTLAAKNGHCPTRRS